mgnify:CR=1 FL=1
MFCVLRRLEACARSPCSSSEWGKDVMYGLESTHSVQRQESRGVRRGEGTEGPEGVAMVAGVWSELRDTANID